MRHNITFIIIFLLISVLVFVGEVRSWPWSRDMYFSPVITHEKKPSKDPESIPTGGVNPVVLAKRKLQNPVLVKNAFADFKNPVRPTDESIKNGERLYNIYCSACHGKTGMGDGEVSKKMVPPQNLQSDYAKNLSDGYIFATIVGGGAIMPSQKKALTQKEVWDIVNYVRKLQGFDPASRWDELNKK